MSIAIVGCTVADVVFRGLSRLPTWPRHTEFKDRNLVFPPEPPLVTMGGNGANAAYAAACSGAEVTLHTQLGADPLGTALSHWLARAGCRLKADGKGASAVNVTAANRSHQRATLFYPGRPIAMPRLAPGRPAPSHLLVCGWPHPPLARIAAGMRGARRRGTFTALDAGPILGRPWTLASLRGVFSALDLFLANEYEIRRITGSSTLANSVRRVRREFSGHLVIKCGAKGSRWFAPGSTKAHRVPPVRVRALNTVGAGDCFNGALLAALARGLGWPAALRRAAATAAAAVASPQGVLGLRR